MEKKRTEYHREYNRKKRGSIYKKELTPFKEKESILFFLEKDEKEKLKELAKKNEVSLSSFLREVVKNILNKS